MSSYRGAWDVGPPGAEAEYAGQRAQHAAPAAPTTDPWTGASYAHYPTGYDYSAYPYPYPYDSAYYHQQRAGTYYGNYPSQQGYEYAQAQRPPREHSRSPTQMRSYDRRLSYRSKSRSPPGSDRRQKSYSRRRDSSYEESRRRRSRSKSSREKNYSSSDRSSSRSRSYSRMSQSREKKKRRSASTGSSASNRSYRRNFNKRRDRDLSSSPLVRNEKSFRSRRRSRSSRTPSLSRSVSDSPIVEVKKEKLEYSKEVSKDRRTRDITQSRKRKGSETPPLKIPKKTDKSSVSPPKTYKRSEYSSAAAPKNYKHKERKSDTPPRKMKDSSLTPPKSYARGESRSSSKSRSRSSTPRHSKRKRSRRSRSRYSSRTPSSASSRRSRSTSARKSRKSTSRHRTRSKSCSKRRSVSENRSTPRRRSRSRGKAKRSPSPKASKSRSRSPSSRSRSRSKSGSTSEDDRRGQFTVADRKRYWKIHRSRQSERNKEPRSPPKEVKPPPGAIDSTNVDDIEYRDPPEVEGPNFAELLPPPDQLVQQASTSKKAASIQIKNDGSFMEMFKKMQEETKKAEVVEKKPEIKKPVLPFIGKRRGGRVLKTGLVKKAKAIDEQIADNTPKDAWSLYMQEVKKYRETSCEEERKTRPLVK